MSSQSTSRPPTRRPPLGEATRRVNNTQSHDTGLQSKQPSSVNRDSLLQDGLLHVFSPVSGSPISPGGYHPLRDDRPTSSPASAVNPRLSAISKDAAIDSKRSSQISTASSAASDGPWKLGRTLGEGATARVRLAKHIDTHQMAAIKIVQKKHAQMSQAGSLSNLEQLDAGGVDIGDGLRKMPVGIEREVAIMKLIQHPNIMKIYDIWENRTEMQVVLCRSEANIN
ncbi:serine/threonine-protein kinase gin4 [Clarireedia jacksonii]